MEKKSEIMDGIYSDLADIDPAEEEAKKQYEREIEQGIEYEEYDPLDEEETEYERLEREYQEFIENEEVFDPEEYKNQKIDELLEEWKKMRCNYGF